MAGGGVHCKFDELEAGFGDSTNRLRFAELWVEAFCIENTRAGANGCDSLQAAVVESVLPVGGAGGRTRMLKPG